MATGPAIGLALPRALYTMTTSTSTASIITTTHAGLPGRAYSGSRNPRVLSTRKSPPIFTSGSIPGPGSGPLAFMAPAVRGAP